MKKNLTLSIIILTGSLLFVACGDSDKGKSEAPAVEEKTVSLDADLQAGKEAFEMSCASCHGELGAGDGSAAAALNPKPRNFKAPAAEWKNGPTIAGITKTLNNGIKGGAMVAYTHLGEETIGQLAKYVLYLHEN